MTRTFILATAAVLGAIGAGAGSRADGRTGTPASVVNEIDVTDASGFATYATREGALIEKFGGKFLVRGGNTESVAGPVPPRVAVYVFDTLAKAMAWRNAPEQAELAAIRDKSSRFRSFIVEGCGTCAPPHG